MIQPELLPIPFARDATSGTKNNIPDVPSPTLPAQTATWTLGFPAVTMQPLAVGGIPPLGQDFNGVLGAISEHTVYQNAGGVYLFDQAFADAIGGYSKGAVLMDDAKGALYASLVDANTTNFNTSPESIGVQWKPIAGLLATETQIGTAAIATQAEVEAGIIDNKIVTPKKLAAKIASIPDASETQRGLIRLATALQAQSFSGKQAITPESLAAAFKGVNQNLSAAGFQKLPGGLMMQWLISPRSIATGGVPFVFPLAFNGAPISIQVSIGSGTNQITSALDSYYETGGYYSAWQNGSRIANQESFIFAIGKA